MAVRRKAKPKPKPKTKTKTKAKAKKPSTGKAWTPAEIAKLRAGYKTKPASKLAKEMRRSLASVRGKISALNLTKGPVKKKTAAKTKAKAKAKPKRKAKARPKAKRRARR